MRCVMLAEAPSYWKALRRLLEQAKVVGPKVHDARVAAICKLHGLTELWSADKDFGRFKGIDVRNPLLGGSRDQAGNPVRFRHCVPRS